MESYAQKKQQALQIFRDAIALANERQLADVAVALQEALERLAEGKMMVVICGEFNRGKSSLINAYLEENLCPVDMDVTTSIISTLSYRDTDRIRVYVDDPNQTRKPVGANKAGAEEETKVVEIEIRRDEIPDYVTEQRNPNNRKKAHLLAMELPNRLLREDVIFVDTPGMESALHGEHTGITYQFLPNANVILFVSHALEPLTSVELGFIKTVATQCPNLMFTVTKIDVNPDYKAILESNRGKLAEVLGRPADQICLVGVSSRAKRDYLKSHDAEDLDKSNFATMQKMLWDRFLDRQGEILIGAANTRFAAAISQMRAPVEAEWIALTQTSPTAMDDKEQEFTAATERIRALRNSSEWIKALNEGTTSIRKAAGQQIQLAFIEIQERLQRYIHDDELQRSPDRILNRIDSDVQEFMTGIWRQVGTAAEKLHQEIAASTHLNLRAFETGQFSLSDPGRPNLPEFKRRQTDFSRVLDGVWRAKTKAAAGSFVGSAVGAVVGGLLGLLGGPAGVVTGAYAGAVFVGGICGAAAGKMGYVEQIRNLDLADHNLAAQQLVGPLTSYRNKCQVLCNDALANLLQSLDLQMQQDLADQMRQEMESAQRIVQSIQQARKMTQAELDKRIAGLKLTLQRIDSLLGAINALMAAPAKGLLPADRGVAVVHSLPTVAAKEDGNDGSGTPQEPHPAAPPPTAEANDKIVKAESWADV
jgi:GTPase Era involved in 16S rRNA processing/cell fate (sporulation/competence/biofilm development) regulator YlbF (YheA/YmcA/DUF963 family)